MTTSEQQPTADEVSVALLRGTSQQRWRYGPTWRWRMTYKGEEVEGKDEYGSITEAAENAAGVYGSLQMKERRERQLANRGPAPSKPEKQPTYPILDPGTLVKTQADRFWWLPVRRDDGPAHDPKRRIYLDSKHGTVWARRDRLQPFPGADAISQFDRVWQPETPPPGESGRSPPPGESGREEVARHE